MRNQSDRKLVLPREFANSFPEKDQTFCRRSIRRSALRSVVLQHREVSKGSAVFVDVSPTNIQLLTSQSGLNHDKDSLRTHGTYSNSISFRRMKRIDTHITQLPPRSPNFNAVPSFSVSIVLDAVHGELAIITSPVSASNLCKPRHSSSSSNILSNTQPRSRIEGRRGRGV
jgi:hypothetical protein